jgi:hypothetical protein
VIHGWASGPPVRNLIGETCSEQCTQLHGRGCASPKNNEPRREPRQGNLTKRSRPRRSVCGCTGTVASFHETKRLSATDISALASMKNVAKCDTWCELQNPVNHRVFERKLRPKPRPRARLPGRLTSRRSPPLAPLWARVSGGRKMAPRAHQCAVGLKSESSTTDVTTSGG